MNIKFETFTENDYETVLPYFSLRPTYTCESHFLYHIIWKDFYNSKYYKTDEAIFWLQTIAGKTSALPPTSNKEHFKDAFYILQDYFTKEIKVKLKLYLLDEEALELLELDDSKYEIIEDRNSFDYIYDANNLRDLIGRKYSKKRNHLNAFLRDYKGKFEYRSLTNSDSDEILEFTHKWAVKKDSDDPYNRIESEEDGIRNVLNSYTISNPKMAGVYIDGKLEAFTIASYDPLLELVAIHTEKANPEIRGLYPYINQQFLVNEFPDAIYINREDDMGIPSLRKAKESYYPISLAKKYTIIER